MMGKSSYKRIGDYIQLVDERNKGLQVKLLLGLSISKQFIPSVANIIGTDMENYKIIRKNQFACSTMQVRRDKKMPVALLQEADEAIISQAYPIFEVKNTNELDPEYLMMWFTRSEFDREACFHAVGGVRGSLEWEDFENMKLPIPHIDKQREIVKEYNTIQNRIALNQQMIQKLEETAQAIYKQWFVEGVDLENLPEGWRVGKISDVSDYINRGITPNYTEDEGLVILNQKCVKNNSIDLEFSRKHNENDKRIPSVKMIKEFDVLVNSTGDGTLGRVGIAKAICFPMTVDSHITILRTNSQNNPIYVWENICGRSEEIANLAEGSTGQTELSRSMFSELPILIPSKDIQDEFAKIIIKYIKHSHLLEQENQKLSELKDLLLSKLATVGD
jgi:type I restriction enzyme S subunit